MTSDGTYNYTYDANGSELTRTNIATGDKWTYEYNSGNEMVSAVETTSGSVVEQSVAYKYDAFGNLLEEDVTVSGVTATTRVCLRHVEPGEDGRHRDLGIRRLGRHERLKFFDNPANSGQRH